MTREELKLEALKYLENFKDCANCKHRWGDCADELDEDCLINNCYSATPKEQDIYLAGAEPREKQIEIDAEHIIALQKQNGELTDKVRELENTLENIRYYLDNEIPHDLINEATTKIWRMLK